MLTAKNLERVMELEDKLRAEYQAQLDAKTTEIEQASARIEELQATVDKQLEQIKTLSADATANKRTEQLNRELNQRSKNLQEEVASQKKRLKSLQKDLAEERAEISRLKKFDPARMKKNLDASKKKLAEKTTANDMLQKSLNKTKAENAELQRKVKELEASAAASEDAEASEEAAA